LRVPARVGRCLFALLLLLVPLQAAESAADLTEVDRHPLRPPNTASPRDTLRSFDENSREAIRRFRARLAPAITHRAVAKTLRCLDLEGLPPAERIDEGFARAVFLVEILGRIELPPIDKIPDIAAVEAAKLSSWTIPDTEITIARTQAGPHAGEFQFSAHTIAELPAFYERAKHLPLRPGASAGFYDEWSHSPGPWLPSGWATNLPQIAYVVVFDQTIWQWLAALATFVLTGVLIVLGYRLARRLDHVGRDAGPRGHIARLIATIAAIALLELATHILDDAVNITGRRLYALSSVLRVALAGASGWLILLSLDAIGAAVIRFRAWRAASIDAHLVRVVVRVLAIVTIIYLVIYVAGIFGIPAAPLLASLGVGGLAIALAVRPTLENIIGGFILFADKPVRVGDFCRYGDQIGTVEEIGLRSTRVRTLERTTVTVPNADFSQMQLDNFSKRDLRLLNTVLQLRYETTPEQLRYVLVQLRELLLGHPMVTPEPARVRFVEFGAYSKNVEIFAYLRCQDQDTFLAIREDILLRIEDIVNAAGSGFAFPSQTTYFSQDVGLDGERRGAAEARVGQWRKRGCLPFPEFEEHERERRRDVLAYPPQGSPHYEPPTPSGDRQRVRDSSTLEGDDLADLPVFVAKLRANDQFAAYLSSRLSDETQELLSAYDGGADAKLKEALVRDLNAAICGPAIYDEQRCSDIDLSPETQELLGRNPEGEELRRLNRMLLQDAYPTELSRRTGGR
jgi:MscS family membrane protein